jgi:hypothetical protein
MLLTFIMTFDETGILCLTTWHMFWIISEFKQFQLSGWVSFKILRDKKKKIDYLQEHIDILYQYINILMIKFSFQS